LKNNEDLV